MSSVLVALMVVVIFLFGLGAVLFLTKVMKAEVEKSRAARPTRPTTAGNN